MAAQDWIQMALAPLQSAEEEKQRGRIQGHALRPLRQPGRRLPSFCLVGIDI